MENLEKLFKIQCLHPFFTFAGFADLLAAKEGQFADCGRTMWPKQIFCSVRMGHSEIFIVDLSAQTRFK